MESFVCYRVIDLIESSLLCICRVYFLDLYLKMFITIFLYDYDFIFIRILFIYLFIHLFIYSICLFILLTYQIFIRNVFMKNLSGYTSENVLYIMIYKYDFELSYIVYRKEQS